LLGLGLWLIQEELDERSWRIGQCLLCGAAAVEPPIAGGLGMGTDDDRVMAGPPEIQVLSLAIKTDHLCGLARGRVRVSGVPKAATAQRRPKLLRNAINNLKSAIAAGSHGERLRKIPQWNPKSLQLRGCRDAVVIDEQKPRDWASKNTYSDSAAGADLQGHILFSERVGLPSLVVGALVTVDGHQGPAIRQSLELLKELLGHGASRMASAARSRASSRPILKLREKRQSMVACSRSCWMMRRFRSRS